MGTKAQKKKRKARDKGYTIEARDARIGLSMDDYATDWRVRRFHNTDFRAKLEVIIRSRGINV